MSRLKNITAKIYHDSDRVKFIIIFRIFHFLAYKLFCYVHCFNTNAAKCLQNYKDVNPDNIECNPLSVVQ